MDPVSRQYLQDVIEAQELSASGDKHNIDIALQTCWSLRLKVDLPIYLRACVNVLLAGFVKDDQKPDMYAREAIDLVNIVREQHKDITDEEPLASLQELEDSAREILAIVDEDSDSAPATPALGLGTQLADMASGSENVMEDTMQSEGWGKSRPNVRGLPQIEGYLRRRVDRSSAGGEESRNSDLGDIKVGEQESKKDGPQNPDRIPELSSPVRHSKD